MKSRIVPIKSSTQSFIEIEDIDRDIVLFSDGSCALVIATTAVNFSLLSGNEQEMLINSYAGLLNSLSFSIQILVRTQHKDVRAYLKQLDDHEKSQKSPKIAASIRSYRMFVATMVKEKNVLDKKFYIIIPFSALELGPSTQVLFGQKKKGLPYGKDYIFDRALAILSPKRDHILRLLNRLGLRGTQLTNEQLALLYFSIYNPTSPTPSIELINKTHSAPLVRESLIAVQKQNEAVFKNAPKQNLVSNVPIVNTAKTPNSTTAGQPVPTLKPSENHTLFENQKTSNSKEFADTKPTVLIPEKPSP